jgi:hypothetical protein
MHRLKAFGYLVSTISVILLAIVAWPKAKEVPILLACLIGGAVTSIVGMFCRWLSYEVEERKKAASDREMGGELLGNPFVSNALRPVGRQPAARAFHLKSSGEN